MGQLINSYSGRRRLLALFVLIYPLVLALIIQIVFNFAVFSLITLLMFLPRVWLPLLLLSVILYFVPGILGLRKLLVQRGTDIWVAMSVTYIIVMLPIVLVFDFLVSCLLLKSCDTV